ncbi:MAG: hypothetical protein M1823_005017 [Watsoniomyces obsoletus]|nr:MAG: hypothetical protein M1823_005017 [Watsoniomyces obsoletus]
MAAAHPSVTDDPSDPETLAQQLTAISLTEDDPFAPSVKSSSDNQIQQSSLLDVTPSMDVAYQDPTPSTPPLSSSISRSASNHRTSSKPEASAGMPESELRTPPTLQSSLVLPDSTVQASKGQTESNGLSSPEIKNIMDQFEDANIQDNAEASTSALLGIHTEALKSTAQHPPRSSSLEPVSPSYTGQPQPLQERSRPTSGAIAEHSIPANITEEIREKDRGQRSSRSDHNPSRPSSVSSPPPFSPLSTRPPSLQKALPPEPDPEPDLPFDFHRFLEQLRHRSADPVARFLRSFLVEFGKKQWMVHEQVKIISDFLTFITNKMAQCEIWQGVSDAEFDNAREGMEKLVMNRLYTQTFSPAIPPPPSSPSNKGKRRPGEREEGPGRRGQHQEDVERDTILTQKMRIYQWVREEHLDLKPTSDSGRRFLNLAQQELSKIKSYRAPRDKVICVLNSCKVIFGLLKNSKSDQSADSFVPLLIYVVLHANPEHLVSNVQYILRFRNQEKLGGEAGYYLSSLMGVIQFIETLDRTSLTISDEDFEKNVEAAVSTIAERSERRDPPQQVYVAEKSSLSRPEVTPRNSLEVEWASPRRSTSSRDGTDASGTTGDEQVAVAGLLRSIQKPLSTIGRIFSEEPSRQSSPRRDASISGGSRSGQTPRRSPAIPQQDGRGSQHSGTRGVDSGVSDNARRKTQPDAEEAAARQASAETAEARRLHRLERQSVVETLSGMFPDLDREVIDDVVREKEGR